MGIATILYVLAYALIFIGLHKEFEKVERAPVQLILVQPLLLGDVASIFFLLLILWTIGTKSRFSIGSYGYLVMSVSHVLRYLAFSIGAIWLLLVAEVMRPLGLMFIALGLKGE